MLFVKLSFLDKMRFEEPWNTAAFYSNSYLRLSANTCNLVNREKNELSNERKKDVNNAKKIDHCAKHVLSTIAFLHCSNVNSPTMITFSCSYYDMICIHIFP